MAITEFQKKVYAALQQIPAGSVSSYLLLSQALGTSPRAVGGALRNNPFAPEVPCHRIISATGHIGGYMGDWHNAPSGINRDKKRDLLRQEGVIFGEDDIVVEKEGLWFDGFQVTQGRILEQQRSMR